MTCKTCEEIRAAAKRRLAYIAGVLTRGRNSKPLRSTAFDEHGLPGVSSGAPQPPVELPMLRIPPNPSPPPPPPKKAKKVKSKMKAKRP